MIWADCLFFFQYVFSFEKSKRCDDIQQTTVTHFGENKKMHLESSKQNYHVMSFWAIMKAFLINVPRRLFRQIFSARTVLFSYLLS